MQHANSSARCSRWARNLTQDFRKFYKRSGGPVLLTDISVITTKHTIYVIIQHIEKTYIPVVTTILFGYYNLLIIAYSRQLVTGLLPTSTSLCLLHYTRQDFFYINIWSIFTIPLWMGIVDKKDRRWILHHAISLS